MRKLLAMAAILCGLATPAAAFHIQVVAPYRASQAQGNLVAVRGRADIHEDMIHQGTDVNLVDDKGQIVFVGFIPKLNEYAFPQLASLNGRTVLMYGIIEIFHGHPATQLIFGDQLRAS
ncbi:MAG: hypothetical protein JO256_02655 [Alphaproteobacteria bacterium]|nr:hypothetical protein [Alphaproteobacteria bacterium]